MSEHLGLYDVSAVTLIDVIVFRGPTEASDVCLWAHELTHVAQYRDQGVHDFAIRYARDPNSQEGPAYAVERNCRSNFGRWQTGGAALGPFPQPLPIAPPPMPALGGFCWTLVGRFGPGPLQPLGAPCVIPTPNGPIYGQIGN